MIIVGGLGSIIGTYFGVALILLMPGIVNGIVAGGASTLGLKLNVESLAHIPNAVYGALIIIILIGITPISIPFPVKKQEPNKPHTHSDSYPEDRVQTSPSESSLPEC